MSQDPFVARCKDCDADNRYGPRSCGSCRPARGLGSAGSVSRPSMIWALAIAALVIIGVALIFLSSSDDGTPVADATTSTIAPTTVPATTVTPGGGAPVANTTEPPPAPPPEIENDEYLAFRQQPTACGAEAPPSALAYEPPEPPPIMATPQSVVLETSCGSIVIELNLDGAPVAGKSFVHLAQLGFFDGTVSHRIIPGFMVQLGDPTATGLGGPGYQLVDELPAADFVYTKGVVAMANSGPDSSGSQFFIVLGDASHLPPTFTVLGSVVDGFDVLDLIDQIPVTPAPGRPADGASYPIESLYFERISVPGL